MKRWNRPLTVVVIAAAGVALALAPGASALASAPNLIHHGIPQRTPPVNEYKVIDKVTISTSYTNKADLLGSCTADGTSFNCNLSRTTSAEVSVQLSLGVSVGDVTAGLGITDSSSISTTVSCSKEIPAGSTFEAWPIGTRYSYKVEHIESLAPTVTSGTLYAFVPRENAVSCGYAS
jgi:hypothetical protein